MHTHDFDAAGFEWIDCHDAAQSVLSYIRRDGDRCVIVILNFTPVPRNHYRIGVPAAGNYRLVMNSDSAYYGGSNYASGGSHADASAWMGRPYSLTLSLPPLAGLVLISD